MPTLWFCLVAVMIAIYVLLDGFDLGAGIVHLGVARNDAERRRCSVNRPGVGRKRSVAARERAALYFSRFPFCTRRASADFICR